MSKRLVVALENRLHPEPVEFDLEPIREVIAAAEDEPRRWAVEDRDPN